MIIEQNENQISLVNPTNQSRVDIDLTAGGLLTRFDVNVENERFNIVKLPFSDRYPLASNPYHPSAVLTPWVNRVRNGNYSFELCQGRVVPHLANVCLNLHPGGGCRHKV